MASKVKAPVGDLDSKERGTAARFNAGKVPYQFLDLRVLAHGIRVDDANAEDKYRYFRRALTSLSRWQHGGNLNDLFDAAHILADYMKRQSDENESTNVMWQGIPWDECAYVFEYGAKKYNSWNWLKGQNWSIPLACALRHLLRIMEGELIDDESGHSHFGHFLANIMMLSYYYEAFPDGDDRPPFIKPTV